MSDKPNRPEIWDREYQELQSIPSSTRTSASKALLLFEHLAGFQNCETVFDAGCGDGRNAVYMGKSGADITATDFSAVARKMTREAALAANVADRIKIVDFDLNKKFSLADSAFDLSLDSYVACHFTTKNELDAYWSEMIRVTRLGGFIFSSMFSNDDEYYAAIARRRPAELPFVKDNVNGITKRIYSESEFKRLFPASLEMTYFLKFEFSDWVIDREYRRSLFVALLQRKK